jgi:hypothetical protein
MTPAKTLVRVEMTKLQIHAFVQVDASTSTFSEEVKTCVRLLCDASRKRELEAYS